MNARAQAVASRPTLYPVVTIVWARGACRGQDLTRCNLFGMSAMEVAAELVRDLGRRANAIRAVTGSDGAVVVRPWPGDGPPLATVIGLGVEAINTGLRQIDG